MKKEFVKKVLEEFKKADIPLHDIDDSKLPIRSRTYCGIKSEHKEQIYKWLKCKLLEEKLIENLN